MTIVTGQFLDILIFLFYTGHVFYVYFLFELIFVLLVLSPNITQ